MLPPILASSCPILQSLELKNVVCDIKGDVILFRCFGNDMVKYMKVWTARLGGGGK